MTDFLHIFLEEAPDMLQAWELHCMRLKKDPTNMDAINALFRMAHNLKGSSESVHLSAFGDFVYIAENILTEAKENRLQLTQKHISALLQTQNHLSTWLKHLEEDPRFLLDNSQLISELKYLSTTDDSHEDLILSESESPSGNSSINGFCLPDDDNQSVKNQQSTPIQNQVSQSSPSTKTISGRSFRVSAEKLEELIKVVEDLLIQFNILQFSIRENHQEKMKEILEPMAKAFSHLQNSSINLKFQPIAPLFQRMERVMRDLARNQDKDLNVFVEGGSVELEKNIIDDLKDPITHLVRNAIDHGIESKNEAVTSKPAKASVTIGAANRGGYYEIFIKDDGKGIDPEMIYRKAIEKNIIEAGTPLSNKEKVELILRNGFSTKNTVTDMSGRGVGMDVVAEFIRTLNGKLEIDSLVGQGTTFHIQIPA